MSSQAVILLGGTDADFPGGADGLLLAHLLWDLRRHGLTDIILAGGVQPEASGPRGARPDGMVIRHCPVDPAQGVAGALRRAEGLLRDEFLLLNGRACLDHNYLDLAWRRRRTGALAALALRQVQGPSPLAEAVLAGDRLTGFRPPGRPGRLLVGAGVCALTRQALDLLPEGDGSLERDLLPRLAAADQLAGQPYAGPYLEPDPSGDAAGLQTALAGWRRRPAVFLDRDGVLNVDHGYVCSPERFEWTPGAPEAVKWLNDQGYYVFVVTNQSGIARGYYSEAQFLAFTAWMNEKLRLAGAHLDATYHCPHHPTAGQGAYAARCDCRKPGPGLVRQALAAWDADPAGSLLIGDKESDMEAARRAGLRPVLFTGGDLLAAVRRCVPPRRAALDQTDDAAGGTPEPDGRAQ